MLYYTPVEKGYFFMNALFPIRVDGSWGREKLLFTRKEAETSASIYFLPLVRRSLVQRRKPFSRKTRYFKSKNNTLSVISTHIGNRAFMKTLIGLLLGLAATAVCL